MANSNTTPPNVALDKIAQLLNNIVDESKLRPMWHCVVVFTQGNHVKMCSFKGTLGKISRIKQMEGSHTIYLLKSYIFRLLPLPSYPTVDDKKSLK